MWAALNGKGRGKKMRKKNQKGVTASCVGSATKMVITVEYYRGSIKWLKSS